MANLENLSVASTPTMVLGDFDHPGSDETTAGDAGPMWTKQRERIASWYQGRYVPPPPDDPGSLLAFISPGHYEQPALAKLLRRLGEFWLDHWKWIIGVVVAIGLALFKGSAGR